MVGNTAAELSGFLSLESLGRDDFREYVIDSLKALSYELYP